MTEGSAGRATGAFATRFPSLYHVTRRSALPGIRARGLRPAASFLVPDQAGGNAHGNRERWTEARDPEGRPVWLRWQSMRDHVLARRLPPELRPDQWREFINGMVFLSPTLASASGLKAFPKDRAIDQVIVCFSTDALLETGCDLRVCRWNNGYPDRRKTPRLRSFDDYAPVADWRRGDPCKEVTVAGGIPPSVPFAVL